MAAIYLIRHGAVDWDAEEPGPNRFRAWDNIALNAHGEAQTAQLGKFLADKGITHVFAGDLVRTKQTAGALKQHIPDAVVSHTSDLRPWDLGALTGVEINKDSVAFMRAYMDNPDEKIPGNDAHKGETYNTFFNRYRRGIENIAAFAKTKNVSVAVVTHSRNVGVTKEALAGETTAPLAVKDDLPPTGVLQITPSGSGYKMRRVR